MTQYLLFSNPVVAESLSYVQLFATPWTVACQAPLSSTMSESLFRFVFTELVMLCNHLILCCLFLLLPSIFPESESFLKSQLFASGDQSIRASASVSVLPMNIQGWFPLVLPGFISLVQGPWRIFSSTTIQKHPFFGAQPSLWSNSQIHTWLLERQ